jgi:hypothetical protein
MISKRIAILTALVIVARTLRFSLYLAQEVFIVLMLTAAMLVVVLLLAIAFILFSSSAHSGFLWLSAKVRRIAGRGHDHVARGESMAVLPPRRL